MRSIDPVIKSRLLLMQQTLYNNAQPSMEVLAIRPRTPIFHKRFWQESIVAADTTATCTSVAVRKTGTKADRVYVAYISGSVLTVKSAALVFPVSSMTWEIEQVIEGCIGCALEFDGSFVRVSPYKIEYRTDDLPWLFYITSSGQLMGGIFGSTYESLVGSNVSSISAVRGVHSPYRDMDQGLLLFYVFAGSVYYRELISGTWGDQHSVGLAPENVVIVRAERTFDWRIVLHITDNTGALFEVFSKMEASGWNSSEFMHLSLRPAAIEVIPVVYIDSQSEVENLALSLLGSHLILYALAPIMVSAENIDNGAADYGYFVVVTFNEKVFGESGNLETFMLIDEYANAWANNSIEKLSPTTLKLGFDNFNNATGVCTLEYTPGTLTGDIEPIAAGIIEFTPTNLVPYEGVPPVLVGIENVSEWIEL